MTHIFHYTISHEQAGLTVYQFLGLKKYSRKLIIQLKKTEDAIQVNRTPVYTNYRLKPEDLLCIKLEEKEASANIAAAPVPLSIFYEDDHLMVVDKQADLPIHPSQGNYDNTLANGIAWYFKQKGEPFVYRCINRLDRDTTGLLIIAKHKLSSAILSRSMKDREIHRTYLAIVHGKPPESGTIDAPIARMEGSTIQRCVNPETGDPAVTHYTRLRWQDPYSLVRLKLETGRTHQIRVHMKHIGCPLIGDFLYYPDHTAMSRQALHSCSLSFCHPITGEQMSFESPLPADMQKVISTD